MMKHYQESNTHVWYDECLVTEPIESLFDINYWRSCNAIVGNASGRGTTWFIKLQSTIAALRHYHRGGLFGKIVRDQYLFLGLERTRSYAEFVLLQKLRSAGVNVPRPIAAKVEQIGLLYRADLLSEKISEASDLVDKLQVENLSNEDYQKIGLEIRKMHDVGVNHTDLNIHNILLDSEGKVWIIDFDKCKQQSGEQWKERNLNRLLRSFRKELGKRKIHWSEDDFESLMLGYNQS
ncbi:MULTISPECIES: 3-deoxy-D-manno-octulosonic acid kinase [Vibrio harveyi group]|uniref:3-deoxy-D-manno-octulosonic acid kinase n=1 Tax=Vibrio harveyi group TaxID=717610 RepID=UPI0012D7F848|nr:MULTISPECIES: 3-deoxy-D-manno-octulosonic acid kinase [Vibrio harveyi group]MDV5046914.1 3-deoxy-D-manno-octulosonic acid kinase [Vibrio diabolicus]